MKEEDLEVTQINPRPPGGQQVGVTEYIIQVKHLPTGLTASSGQERSQYKNRKIALFMIEQGLKELGWRDLDVSKT